MRILILGADGQLGHELSGVLTCFADVVSATEHDFDMTDSAALRAALDRAAPTVVVNAAAYTDVDGAEKDESTALRVNAEAVSILGEEATRRGVGLVHFSTDFVFDGQKSGAYVEDDPPNPVSAYGKSKLAGEVALQSQQAPALVLRTAWLYSVRSRSFVATMLRLARERETLSVVTDQVGSPTFARDLAEATGLVLYGIRKNPLEQLQETRGVYHLAGTGSCSRYELAKAAIELDPQRDRHKVKSIVPATAADFPAPAARPANSALDCTKLYRTFGVRLPPWRDSLARALAG